MFGKKSNPQPEHESHEHTHEDQHLHDHTDIAPPPVDQDPAYPQQENYDYSSQQHDPYASQQYGHDEHTNLPAVHHTTPDHDAYGAENSLILKQQQQLAEHKQNMRDAAARKVSSYTDLNQETPDFVKARSILSEALIDRIDYKTLEGMSDDSKRAHITEIINKLIGDITIPLTSTQHALLRKQLIAEVLGFGPLETLLEDPEVSDIMVNGPNQVYIEKAGKLSMTDITFTSDKHLLNIIQKIVQRVGRRVDETSPMVDARMPDGSRFNAIIPPLALDGSLVSIRKFKKQKMPLKQYVDYGSASPEMARFLEICGAIRLNILISGGTGSGKTTLLNALSGNIDQGERVITIEDAAELQLHQPHVLRLETRPPNTEGVGEVTQRQLVKNALRMRPDRIILGEIRGDEVIDVLQAMNTGHEGSMATIHANNPRECLSRLENLFGLTGMSLPLMTLRSQISSAIHLVIQISRMRDGGRRITHIEEIVGMEGETIITQTLFQYKAKGLGPDGRLMGEYICNRITPRFIEQAAYFGMDKEMRAALGLGGPGGGM